MLQCVFVDYYTHWNCWIYLVLLPFVLNLTVTDGNINAVLFYANIVSIISPIFFPNNNSITDVLVSLLNLDLGIETCFYNGVDALAKKLLQLVFSVYLIFIASLIIITSHYSSRIQQLTACRALPALATLFLLSYTKTLLAVSNVLFFYSTITHLPSNDITLVCNTFTPEIRGIHRDTWLTYVSLVFFLTKSTSKGRSKS